MLIASLQLIKLLFMDKQIDKYPYKKILYLQWYEAAIANLILFKFLKERYMNHIYFLISDQGILLKATNNNYLKTTEEQINKFFTAKIEQLEITASSDFYEKILEDIREQTEKLKDTRDCPYINLVYSEKLKNSCLTLKKFGYSKPYENWEITEREKRGFCYLIVRPEHRWKEIASNVMLLVKKREGNIQKSQKERTWQVELNYQKFIWLYLRKEFETLKKNLEVKEKKGELVVIVTFKDNITDFIDLQKIINTLEFRYSDQKPNITEKYELIQTNLLSKTAILSSLELEKTTDLIYHQFGLPNLVRQIRSKNSKYLIIGPTEQIHISLISQQLIQPEQKSRLNLRQDIGRMKDESKIAILFKLGHSHEIINYDGMNFVMSKFEIPLKKNIEIMLKHRLPSLPRYFYCLQKNQTLYLFRKYQPSKLKSVLENQSLNNQIFLINSLVLIVQELHKRQIFIGQNFTQRMYVDGLRIVVEPSQYGSKAEDISKLILLVRQLVKNMRQSQIKDQLEKINDPFQMLPIFDGFISENYL